MVKFCQKICSCFAKTNCAHILACRLFYGADIVETRNNKNKELTKNLTQLKANMKENKFSGRNSETTFPNIIQF